MNRYQAPAIVHMKPSPDGIFCKYSDAVEALQSAIQFAFEHKEEIQNDTDGFGTLKPILAMIEGVEVEH